MTILPHLVAHADWSVTAAKRWLALATLHASTYRAQPPQPVGDPQTLLSRLQAQAASAGAAVLDDRRAASQQGGDQRLA